MSALLVVTSIVLSVLTEINQKNVYIGTIKNAGLGKINTNKKKLRSMTK